jgi:hypothetical protein
MLEFTPGLIWLRGLNWASSKLRVILERYLSAGFKIEAYLCPKINKTGEIQDVHH